MLQIIFKTSNLNGNSIVVIQAFPFKSDLLYIKIK